MFSVENDAPILMLPLTFLVGFNVDLILVVLYKAQFTLLQQTAKQLEREMHVRGTHGMGTHGMGTHGMVMHGIGTHRMGTHGMGTHVTNCNEAPREAMEEHRP